MTKRVVKIYENDKLIYEGPENRQNAITYSSEQDRKKYMGGLFTMPEIVKYTIAVVTVLIYIVRADMRLTSVESVQESIARTNQIMAEFMVTSDSYHSAITGSQFRGGRPVINEPYSDSYNSRKREIKNKETNKQYQQEDL